MLFGIAESNRDSLLELQRVTRVTWQKDVRSPLPMSSFVHIKPHICTTCACVHMCAHRSVPPGPIVPRGEQTRRHVCRRSATLYSLFRARPEETAQKISLRLASMHSYVCIFKRGPRCSQKTCVWVRGRVHPHRVEELLSVPIRRRRRRANSERESKYWWKSKKC